MGSEGEGEGPKEREAGHACMGVRLMGVSTEDVNGGRGTSACCPCLAKSPLRCPEEGALVGHLPRREIGS